MLEPRAVRCPPSLTLTGLLRPQPPATRYILRGGESVRAAAADAFGVGLPATPCRAASGAGRAALWLGPDEWLLLAAESEAGTAAATLDAALSRLPHSLVDVSHRQIACSVAGSQAATLLNSGCPLDLDLQAFPVHMCTRTVLAKAQVVLWRTAAQSFHLEVARSFAAYVSLFLAEAARGMTTLSQGASS